MAYLDRPLSELARELRHLIRAEIRKALQEVEAEKRLSLVRRISTPDPEGAIHRWIRPSQKHIGQMVRPTAHLGMNPCHLPEMKLLDVSEPDMDFEYPFLCEDSEGNHKGFAHAWVEVQQERASVGEIQKHIEETLGLEPGSVALTHINYAKEEQPEAPKPEPWRPKVGDWVKINKPEEPNNSCDWVKSMDKFDGSILRVEEGPSGDCYHLGGDQGWYFHLSWLEPAEAPKPEEPKPLEVEPVPAHPEPVEIKALEVKPGSTIYVHNGKTYRMVNSQDIGKEVLVSDEGFNQAIELSVNHPEDPSFLTEIIEEDQYPIQTDDGSSWKIAFIEDPSLAVPAEPTKIDPLDEALIRSEEHFKEIFQLPPGAKLWTPDSPVAVEPVEEPKHQKYPKRLGPEWRFLEPEEIFQDDDMITSSGDQGGWVEVEALKGKPVSIWVAKSSSFLAARRIDAQAPESPAEPEPAKPKVSELGPGWEELGEDYEIQWDDLVNWRSEWITATTAAGMTVGQWRSELPEDRKARAVVARNRKPALTFPIACEVVPAPDGSTTDPELPPLLPVDDEEEEVTGPELFYHEGKAYRLAGDEDLGKRVYVSDISFKNAMTGFPIELTKYYYQETSKYGSYSTKWVYAFIEATEEPEATAEPEWITPGPEHVGQMVEVREENQEPWRRRILLAIIRRAYSEKPFICQNASGGIEEDPLNAPHGEGCPWKYARIRKA